MFSRSILVLVFVAGTLCSQAVGQEAGELGRVARLERIAADMGALGMTAEAAKYRTRAANERAMNERRLKAIANAADVSQKMTDQIGLLAKSSHGRKD